MKKLIPILAILYFGISINSGLEKQKKFKPALKPMTIQFIDSCKKYKWDTVKIKYQLDSMTYEITTFTIYHNGKGKSKKGGIKLIKKEVIRKEK